MVTSKLPAVPFFTHAVSFSKRRDFRQCFIILMLSSLMVVYSLASSMALSSIFSVIDGFYINTSSNHPRSIIKQIPTSVSHRLSDNSANEEIFNKAKTEYENALKTSGHTADLEFNPNRPKKRNRKRNIIWFNPPFNKNIKTNIGKTFLKLIDKHFP